MDVRLHKRKINVLNTTDGLNHARATAINSAALDKINIHFEVRIKDVLRRSSQTTDPAYGKWGRPWGKDEYLSGTICLAQLWNNLLKGLFTEVLDDCLSTVNLIWEKERAISLIRYVVPYQLPVHDTYLTIIWCQARSRISLLIKQGLSPRDKGRNRWRYIHILYDWRLSKFLSTGRSSVERIEHERPKYVFGGVHW